MAMSSDDHTPTVNLGIVGAGLMGRLFGDIAWTLPGANVIGVHDVDNDAVVEAAERWEAKVLRSVEELTALDELDAVLVATPETEHLEVALAALTARKHVFIEKPLAHSVDDAMQIVEAGKQAERIVAVGHVLRHDPAYGRARTAVLRGDIGEVVHVYARRNTSVTDADRLAGRVSIVDYLGVHDIDALHFVMGETVTSVMAHGTRRRMARYGQEDAVQSLLKFKSGAIGSLECSWLRPEGASGALGSAMSLWGVDGVIEVRPYAAAFVISGRSRDATADQAYLTEPGPRGDIAGIYRDELLDFTQCVRSQGTPACSGEEGLAAVRVAAAIKQSLATRSEVPIDEA